MTAQHYLKAFLSDWYVFYQMTLHPGKGNFPMIRVVMLWHRMPREMMKSPSLEFFKNRLDKQLPGIDV